MKDEVKELKRRFNQLFQYVKTVEATNVLLERRLKMLEDLVIEQDEEEVCSCGQDHGQLVSEILGHIVHIEFHEPNNKGPWFLVVSGNASSLYLQELSGPELNRREKIGDLEWVPLSKINKVTLERTM